jgi:hypothetical protein
MTATNQLLVEALYYLGEYQAELRERTDIDPELADLIKRIKVQIQ